MTAITSTRRLQNSVLNKIPLTREDIAFAIFMGFTINLMGTNNFGDSVGFVRKIYQIAMGIFKCDPNRLIEILNNTIGRRLEYGFEIPTGLNPRLIALSDCPFREFDQQMVTLYGGNPTSPHTELFEEGVLFPVVEAILVQHTLQHEILYSGVKKVVKRFSPAPRYTEFLRTRAYMICRVFATAMLYAMYQSSTHSYRTLVVDLKENDVYHAFLLGIALGMLNGLNERPLAILIHIINNVFWFCMRQVPRC